jgi:restriction endonuclease S subunit
MVRMASGGTFKEISKTNFSRLKIPLPPLSVQKEIVAEIEGYQKIIDGARQVVENYKPRINVDETWEMVELGEVCDISTGKLNANVATTDGQYPFFTCSKDIFKIDTFAFDGEAVLLSGNNATGHFDVKHYKGKFNAYQRTYVITIKKNYLNRLEYQLLKIQLENNLKQLKDKSIGGLTKYLTLNMITTIPIPLPPLKIQKQIVAQIEEEQELVEANRKLIEIFEKKIKAKIAEVWGEEAPSDAEPELLMVAEEKAEYGVK